MEHRVPIDSSFGRRHTELAFIAVLYLIVRARYLDSSVPKTHNPTITDSSEKSVDVLARVHICRQPSAVDVYSICVHVVIQTVACRSSCKVCVLTYSRGVKFGIAFHPDYLTDYVVLCPIHIRCYLQHFHKIHRFVLLV